MCTFSVGDSVSVGTQLKLTGRLVLPEGDRTVEDEIMIDEKYKESYVVVFPFPCERRE